MLCVFRVHLPILRVSILPVLEPRMCDIEAVKYCYLNALKVILGWLLVPLLGFVFSLSALCRVYRLTA